VQSEPKGGANAVGGCSTSTSTRILLVFVIVLAPSLSSSTSRRCFRLPDSGPADVNLLHSVAHGPCSCNRLPSIQMLPAARLQACNWLAIEPDTADTGNWAGLILCEKTMKTSLVVPQASPFSASIWAKKLYSPTIAQIYFWPHRHRVSSFLFPVYPRRSQVATRHHVFCAAAAWGFPHASVFSQNARHARSVRLALPTRRSLVVAYHLGFTAAERHTRGSGTTRLDADGRRHRARPDGTAREPPPAARQPHPPSPPKSPRPAPHARRAAKSDPAPRPLLNPAGARGTSRKPPRRGPLAETHGPTQPKEERNEASGTTGQRPRPHPPANIRTRKPHNPVRLPVSLARGDRWRRRRRRG
jgi:hypothetical protein